MFRDTLRFAFVQMASLLILLLVAVSAGVAQCWSHAGLGQETSQATAQP